MGSAVVSNNSKRDAWRAFVVQISTVKVRLFTNNVTPGPTTVLSDFTEASYPGYVEVSWLLAQPPIVAPDNKARMPAFAASFVAPTSGSPVDIYGAMLAYQDITSTFRLMMSRLFPGGPITLSVGDEPITILNGFNWWDPDHP